MNANSYTDKKEEKTYEKFHDVEDKASVFPRRESQVGCAFVVFLARPLLGRVSCLLRLFNDVRGFWLVGRFTAAVVRPRTPGCSAVEVRHFETSRVVGIRILKVNRSQSKSKQELRADKYIASGRR